MFDLIARVDFIELLEKFLIYVVVFAGVLPASLPESSRLIC